MFGLPHYVVDVVNSHEHATEQQREPQEMTKEMILAALEKPRTFISLATVNPGL
jgi:hypothetical protein